MRYPYVCPDCKEEYIIEKHNSISDREEKCKNRKCQAVLNRVYGSTGIKTSDGVKGPK